MKYCPCDRPPESPNPRNADECNACGRPIDPARLDSRENIRAFFDRLATAIFPLTKTEQGMAIQPTREFEAFVGQAEARWEEGRPKFGRSYLRRDNNAAGREEHADGINYSLSDVLQHGGLADDRELDLALEEAFHLYKAYCCNVKRSARRRGSP